MMKYFFCPQALLCSKFVSSDLCDFVLRRIEDQKMKDMTSIFLLCLPHVNRYTEVRRTSLLVTAKIIGDQS